MTTNWNLLNTIGCWIGGMATAIAAYIAWQQFKQDNKKQLKLKVEYQLLFLNPILGGKYIGNQLILKIMNIGSKAISITGWGINTKKMNFAFINMQNTAIQGVDLPVKIESNDCITLTILTSNLYKELEKYVNEGLLNEKSKLTFFVQDSFDKMHKIKTEITYRQVREYATMKTHDD